MNRLALLRRVLAVPLSAGLLLALVAGARHTHGLAPDSQHRGDTVVSTATVDATTCPACALAHAPSIVESVGIVGPSLGDLPLSDLGGMPAPVRRAVRANDPRAPPVHS